MFIGIAVAKAELVISVLPSAERFAAHANASAIAPWRNSLNPTAHCRTSNLILTMLQATSE